VTGRVAQINNERRIFGAKKEKPEFCGGEGGSLSKKITVTRIRSKLTLLELLRRVATRAATARRETTSLVEVDTFIMLLIRIMRFNISGWGKSENVHSRMLVDCPPTRFGVDR
jgi:hypothetical protein